jgi:hypothetical protein
MLYKAAESYFIPPGDRHSQIHTFANFLTTVAKGLQEYREPGRQTPVHYCNISFSLTNHCVCKILGFHGGDYEECRNLGCGAV